MGALSATIDIDGKHVATLKSNNYAAVQLPVGRQTVIQRWKAGLLGNGKFENKPLTINVLVVDGRANYLSLKPAARVIGPAVMFNWALSEVREEAALQEIASHVRTDAI